MKYTMKVGHIFLTFLLEHNINETDVTINANIGLLLCSKHFHNMQLHPLKLFSLTFHQIYESLIKI